MTDFAALVEAVAQLLWPIFAITVAIIYRRPLSDSVRRFKRGKIFGQEFEFELQQLEMNTQAMARQVPAAPSPERLSKEVNEEAGGGGSISVDDSGMKIVEQLLEDPQKSKGALVILAAEIERELRKLVAVLGHLKGSSAPPLNVALKIFERQGLLPAHLAASVEQFMKVRSRIVHGQGAESDEVIRAIDSGWTLLRAIKAIPHEVNVVFHPGVPLYADPDCVNELPGVRAVILETTGVDGKCFRRAFPTTRSHFQKGKQVAWEWNLNKVWQQAWYKDPETQQVKKDWDSAGEFVGRHIEEL